MKKRILSLVLTLVLAFSLAVPAMAISPDLEAPYKAKIKSEAPKWAAASSWWTLTWTAALSW